VIDALTAEGDDLSAMTSSTSRSRVTGSRTTAAVNANEPPGVDGEDVGNRDGCALDAAFPGIRLRGN
jgi:hypothetical protein